MKRKELISKLKSCKHDIYMSGKTTFSHNNGLIFIASFLEEVINYLATQPQQPAKELYEKVYIRSEEDLPREVGNYPVHQIGFEPDYVMSMYYNGLSDNFWMQAYDWYLRPLE